MPESWNTKYGPRRVRRDPPTLAEAIAAAQGLTADREHQVEVAAGLMGVSAAEIRAEMKKLDVDRASLITTVAPSRDTGAPRTVVVERRASRRIVARPGRPAAGRSLLPPQRAR